ncbi:MAG: hypothetical protein GY847_20920 [Proteobacteria bacterium]|nr:hypothetical protein [Pseudomonadota bacterium]
MYNGIGLETARGSGTNGYVQRNLGFLRVSREKEKYRTEADIEKFALQVNREPNVEILEHQKKRQVELKCTELEDLMEEQGYAELIGYL